MTGKRSAEMRPGECLSRRWRVLGEEPSHAAMTDLVPSRSHEYQVDAAKPGLGKSGHCQEAGNTGAALAGAGEPARHRRRDDDSSSRAAIETADDIVARYVVAISTFDLQVDRLSSLLGRIEQRLVARLDQDHWRRPVLALLVDVVGVDLAARMIDGQQQRRGLSRERVVECSAVGRGEIGSAVEGQGDADEATGGV